MLPNATDYLSLPAYGCSTHTAWPLPGARHVGAYQADDGSWEVLELGVEWSVRHAGPGLERPSAEALAELARVALLAEAQAVSA